MKAIDAAREAMREEMEFAKSETKHYQEQYERMFNSVSGLNKRIEELEEQKKHLLDKMKKKTGDKSDLDYLVKTQGLENIESKRPESTIEIEDYNPSK
jgi:predicted  nucleic acid-binding Zn-ribbon protein